jgi:hypothetical protein
MNPSRSSAADLPANTERVTTARIYPRFTLGQRWEHALLILSFTVLLLTGLPQKYFSS